MTIRVKTENVEIEISGDDIFINRTDAYTDGPIRMERVLKLLEEAVEKAKQFETKSE